MNDKTNDGNHRATEMREQDWLETELQSWGAEAAHRAVPSELEHVLRSGINASGRVKRIIRIRRRTGYAAVVALLLAGILMTASVSPAFAAALQHIPGMSRILNLIVSDPGLRDAIDHDYMQPIGRSDAHDGTVFTVDGIVADEVRMNVFYTVRLAEPKETNYFGVMNIRDGDTLQGVQAAYSFNMEADKEGIYRGIADIQMGDGIPVPDTLQVEFSPDSNDQLWKVKFPVDKSKSTGQEEIIQVHKTVTVGGQKITIDRVNIFPTRLTVDVSFDPSNSKRIFGMSEVTIVNEKGKALQNKSAFLGETEETLHFDTSYFDHPESLTLKVGRIMALDKDKMTMKLDLNAKKILQAPDDQVSLTNVSLRQDGSREVNLLLQGPTIATDKYGYMLASELTDASGKKYEIGSRRFEMDGKTNNIFFDILSAGQLQNPVSITLSDYPAWIEEPFEVKLK